MNLEIIVYSTLKGENWDALALARMPGIDDVGIYKVYEDMPPMRLMKRASFFGFNSEPASEHDKLHQHLLKLHKSYPDLKKVGVEEIIVFYTILSDRIHTPTEISGEDIAILSAVNANLAITFDAPDYMRAL